MSPRAWTVVRRQFHKQTDLRIVTEGEYTERDTGVQPDLGAERIIRVRGPQDLPQRATAENPKALGVKDKAPIQFRVRPIESSREIWDAFVAAWGTECWYCGMQKQHSRRELQLDHIEPNKQDGTNDDCWNRALACIDCNMDKRKTLTPEQTMDVAFRSGRIATEGLRAEQTDVFDRRHQWAKSRYERLKAFGSQ